MRCFLVCIFISFFPVGGNNEVDLLGDLWAFDFGSNMWTELEFGTPNPGPLTLVSGVSVQPAKFVIYGGLASLNFSQTPPMLWVFDTTLQKWTLVDGLPPVFSYYTVLTSVAKTE